MSLDRFVYWTERKPSREEIHTILKDYLNGCGEVEDVRIGFYLLLPGRSRSPFHTVSPKVRAVDEALFVESHELRHIEIWISKGSLDIVTRQADEFTNNIAEGIAKLFARYYEGRLVQG